MFRSEEIQFLSKKLSNQDDFSHILLSAWNFVRFAHRQIRRSA